MKKLFLLFTLTLFALGQMWAANYTFNSGTTIYIDCRNFADQIKIPKANTNGYEDNKRDGNTVYAVTFTANVTWSTSSTFIKPYPGGDSQSVKFQVPGDGQNCVLVAEDGKSFSWTTYDPNAPSVSFSGLASSYIQGQNVVFAATSENVENPAYTFYVKQGEGEYGSAVTSYTFDAAGSYTVKVEVRANAAGEALAYAEKTISVGYVIAAGTTIYFDGHLFSGQIRYPKTDANEPGSKVNIETLKAITFPNERVWYTSEIFVKPYPNDGQDLNFIVPEAGQNCVIIAADGLSYEWGTYNPNQPSVEFEDLGNEAYYGQHITFAATASNMEAPVSYAYYIKQGSGDYGSAITEYTFDDAGDYPLSYTVKVVATDANSVSVDTEQEITCYKYTLMQNNHTATDKGSAVTLCSTTDGVNFNAVWTCPANEVGTAHYFYVTKNTDPSAQTKCDFLYNNREITETSSPQKISLYGATDNQYNHSWLLTPTRAGDYTFTLTLGSTNYFDCEFPPLVDPAVEFSGLASSYIQGQNVVFAATSQNVENPAYTFYVKQGEGEYGDAVTDYTFADAGSYTVKVEVRNVGETGEALATATKAVTVEEGHIFTAGTTIYIDCRNLVGKIKIPKNNEKGYENDQRDGGVIYEVTFTADVTWKPNDTFIKPKPTGGSESSLKFIVPTGNQNCVIVPAAGNSFTWGYYNPNEPNVAFNSTFPAKIAAGEELEFLASYVSSENVTEPAYTFYVQGPNDAEYGSAVSSYTFAEVGTYLVKVEVRETGATGDALAYAEQAIASTNSYTVYFKNTLEWSTVYIHLYTDDKSLGTNGIGGSQATVQDAMTQIGESEFYEYTYQAIAPFTKVCFTKLAQYNYNDFSGENVSSWSDHGYNVANNKVLWTPDATQPTPINNRSYYNIGQWSAYPPSSADVVFDNLPEEVLYGNAVTFAAIASNIEEPVTFKYYIKLNSAADYGEAIDGDTYSFPAAGLYNVKVEAYASGATAAAAIDEASIRCAKFELMMNNRDVKGTSVAECTTNDGTSYVAYWTCAAAGTYYFYMTKDAAADDNKDCDYLNANQTLSDGGSGNTAYLYGTSKYDHSYKLVAPNPGVYTFTLTLGSTIKFKCNFPGAGQEVIIYEIAAGYATMYADKPLLVPDGMDAFYVSGVDNSGNLTMVTLDKIPANTGVILHALNPTYDAEGQASYMLYECEAQDAIDGNMLKGTLTDEEIDNQHTHYIMTLSNNVPGLYWPYGTNAGVGAFENKAGKAYLEVPATTPISGNVIARRGFPFIPQSDMPTSVESVESKVESGKILREGNLFIIRDGRIFNAQGARIR